MTLTDLPIYAGPDVLNSARMIDAIWFKKGIAKPVCFFEIEHSTSVYSGLLRVNDVRIDYPLPKAFIVAAPNRCPLFERQIGRGAFVDSGLSEVCQFLSYEDVKKLMQCAGVFNTLFETNEYRHFGTDVRRVDVFLSNGPANSCPPNADRCEIKGHTSLW